MISATSPLCVKTLDAEWKSLLVCQDLNLSQHTSATQHTCRDTSQLTHYFFAWLSYLFRQSQRQPAYLVWLPSPLSGVMAPVIGVIIPPYADSLSLNPLRSTLCHARLTCLRWCQVLAVSRRLPYATVLLSPPMSVKRVSTWAQNTVCSSAHPETQPRWQSTETHTHTHNWSWQKANSDTLE